MLSRFHINQPPRKMLRPDMGSLRSIKCAPILWECSVRTSCHHEPHLPQDSISGRHARVRRPLSLTGSQRWAYRCLHDIHWGDFSKALVGERRDCSSRAVGCHQSRDRIASTTTTTTTTTTTDLLFDKTTRAVRRAYASWWNWGSLVW
jgi:hypothetical protein